MLAAPSHVAVTYCPECGRVAFARHVNAEREIPRRYCRVCGSVLGVAIYTFHHSRSGEGPP
jgi:ribosomal protein S27AE